MSIRHKNSCCFPLRNIKIYPHSSKISWTQSFRSFSRMRLRIQNIRTLLRSIVNLSSQKSTSQLSRYVCKILRLFSNCNVGINDFDFYFCRKVSKGLNQHPWEALYGDLLLFWVTLMHTVVIQGLWLTSGQNLFWNFGTDGKTL